MIGGKGAFELKEAIEEAKTYLDRKDTGYFVVAGSSSNRLIGFRRWELHDGFYFTRELYVAPGMRRKGIARKLIRFLEKWLLEKGQDIACISCVPRNKTMIALACSEGYCILNMIEMRKNLIPDNKDRHEEEALGLKWKVM